jgi:uncharacterized protein YhaN
MSITEPANTEPPRAHVKMVYLGPVAPHWEVRSSFGDASAVDEFRGAHAERLEAAATAYFATFSGVEGRRVVLDEAFAAHVVEPGGDAAAPEQLSQGARDQLAVALRLAVADLLAADVRLPLVFDDPFLNWDEARTERLAVALKALARDRQVVVLSHRGAVAGWGEAVVVQGS